jgi:hypothetical protein
MHAAEQIRLPVVMHPAARVAASRKRGADFRPIIKLSALRPFIMRLSGRKSQFQHSTRSLATTTVRVNWDYHCQSIFNIRGRLGTRLAELIRTQ